MNFITGTVKLQIYTVAPAEYLGALQKTPHLELAVGLVHSVEDLARMRLVLVIPIRRGEKEIDVWRPPDGSAGIELLEQELDAFLTDEEAWARARAELKPELDSIMGRASALPHGLCKVHFAQTELEAAQGGDSLELHPIARWIVLTGRVWWSGGKEEYHGWYPLSHNGLVGVEEFLRTELEAPSHELRDRVRQSPEKLRQDVTEEDVLAQSEHWVRVRHHPSFMPGGRRRIAARPGWTRITKKFFCGEEEITEDAYNWLLLDKQPGA